MLSIMLIHKVSGDKDMSTDQIIIKALPARFLSLEKGSKPEPKPISLFIDSLKKSKGRSELEKFGVVFEYKPKEDKVVLNLPSSIDRNWNVNKWAREYIKFDGDTLVYTPSQFMDLHDVYGKKLSSSILKELREIKDGFFWYIEEGIEKPPEPKPKKQKKDEPLKVDKTHVPFDLPRTFNARAKANLKAIQLLMSKPPSSMTKADRDNVRKYTGWGGFKSVQEWNEKITDPNWIITDDAITFEYYTPYELTYSIKDKILPIIQGKKRGFLSVPKWNDKYLALEGSAGIGRFVDPLYTDDFQWNTIEPAIQSATVLMALYPESKTNIMTFDEWAFTNEPIGVYSVVLGNPPYKNRGSEIQEDPSWADYKRAEHYQLLRTLPMLNKGGLSVMVIPRATMSAKDKTNRKVREEMLKYAHLIGAIRLPTDSLIDGKLKDAVFHNVGTPIDVLFLQARGGKLKEVKFQDEYILNGEYFEKYPSHVMGTVLEPNKSVTIDGKRFDNKFMFTKIIMRGKFEGLIDFDMRPIVESKSSDFEEIIKDGQTSKPKRKAEKIIRGDKDTQLDESIIKMMGKASQEAYHLVPKIQDFIKNIELKTDVSRMEAHAVREGINTELKAFVAKYGNPRAKGMLASLKQKDPFRYNVFISVFTKDGNPIGEVAKPLPLRFEYNGDTKDYNAMLLAWYRHAQKYKQFPVIKENDLKKVFRVLKIDDKTSFEDIAIKLSSQGWCLNPTENHDVYSISPEARYYEGDLWPKYDALKKFLKQSDDKPLQLTQIYEKQLSRLIDPNPQTKKSLMDLMTFGDLISEKKVTPTSSFVSEALLNKFFDSLREEVKKKTKGITALERARIVIDGQKYHLEAQVGDIIDAMDQFLDSSYTMSLVIDGKKKKDRYEAIVILKNVFPSMYMIYSDNGILKDPKQWLRIDNDDLRSKDGFNSILSPKQQMFFGMISKDAKIFRPVVANNTKSYSGENVFGAKVRIKEELENEFLDFLSNVQQREYWQPLTDTYNRMFRGYVEPNYYLGEDIVINGWEGYGLRPYQAEAVRKMLYQKQGLLAFDVGLGKTLTGIATIAMAKQQGWCQRPLIVVPNSILFKWKGDILKALPEWKIVTIGANQYHDANGNLKSKTDTPEERGEKWLQFSLGAYDVALLTYSMLDRTQFRENTYGDFSMKHLGAEENIFAQIAEKRRQGKSEAKLQAKKQAIESQIAQMLLPPKSQRIFDKGVTWEDIGIDLMLIDEAQNFKNLFVPKTEFSTPPKFLGANPASKASYNLDIRVMQVRNVAQRKYGSNNVFLLSATPAKNSPMEFYNLIQYIDPNIFIRYGIRSSSDFYDRFIGVEHGDFYNAKLEVQEYPQVKYFTNLDDFRAMLKRYCTFEVFETIIKRYPEIEKSIKVPSVNNKVVRMKVNDLQNELITDIQRRMGKVDLDEEGNIVQQQQVADEDKLKALEGIVIMQLICIHPILIEDKFKVYDEEEEIPDDPDVKKAKKKKKGKRLAIPEIEKVLKKIDIHSPKLDAVTQNITRLRKDASRIMGDITCGNIVFIQNIVVQYMIRDLLIQAGIPKWSIGIMNATILKDPQSRQNLAEAFNFVSEFYVLGDKALNETEYEALSSSKKKKATKINGYRYDIIIANSIAYEGIDLQHRTCAIHHVDLAWESATITQRNGRGVRSGNEYEDVDVYYYIMENTVDQFIYLTIQGKREWLVSAIESQDREINNLGATENSAEAMLQLTATSQEDYERRKAIARKKAEEKRIENMKKLIFAQIKKTGVLFAQARGSADPRDKDNAERAMEALKMKDASIYPSLYYVDELRYSKPTTFKSYMYDIALIKGLIYTRGNSDLEVIYMYIGSQRDGNSTKFKFFAFDGYGIGTQIVSEKQIFSALDSPLEQNVSIPFFVGKNRADLSSLGDAVAGFDEIATSFSDSALKHIYGKDTVFKGHDKNWSIAKREEERDKKVIKPSNSEKLQIERKQTFYRWLMKNGYINIVDINGDSGARAKNMLYTSLVKQAKKKVDDRMAMHKDLEEAAKNVYEIPQTYREEMYRQGFLDMMVNTLRQFGNFLVTKNTVDNSIWILMGSKSERLFDMELEKVDKDGFTFHVPKRKKYKPKPDVVTLENADKFISPLFMDIYEILKGFISISTFDIKDALKEKGYRMRESVLYDMLRGVMTDRVKNSQMIKQVLGLDLSGLKDGGYVGLIPSRPYKIEKQVNVNIELFEPNATGFREFSKMVRDGAKIFTMQDYKYVAPYTFQLKDRLQDRVGLENFIDTYHEIDKVNERYFGIGRRQKFKYTKFLLKYIKRG